MKSIAPTGARASFSDIAQSTPEDWEIINREAHPYDSAVGERVIEHLKLLEGEFGGFPVDRLNHSLQSATLAHRDGRDTEYVVCALLHDIGDTLGSYNHSDIAAAILHPFVSPDNHWMIKHHGIFQGYFYFQYLGLDRNMRERYRDQPELFHLTEEFCAKYDGPAFVKDADVLPLSFFEPMVREIFSRSPHSIYTKSGN
ncbi:HD domain-containing protein [Paraburkholderia pallida]|uniref:HD domain-containing protein n=1 Tax=Paraburkholderia pallida TaxID=2547399 RepID=A0A4P7DB56_9BURK|nr:HD domain-containing protein [Paraburkholderia pallida]QBR04385.1 HD domain-containing protein [Paraburkholderia pallida]